MARLGDRRIDWARVVAYPLVGAMALGTMAARFGWIDARAALARHVAVDPPVVLTGKTAEGQPISVSLDHAGVINALQTSLTGACSNGGTDQIGWSPNSPRIPFQRTAAGVVVKEFKRQKISAGIVVHRWAWTVAYVDRDSVSGDAQYYATYRWPNGRDVTCDSGPIHWTARRSGSAPAKSNTSTYSLGAWAGYAWLGHVRSVQATWMVPTIRAGSPAGVAASWIGAQAPTRPPVVPLPGRIPARAAAKWRDISERIPFIQVGVIESRGWSSNERVSNAYFAFWTDSVHGFQPISLFSVRAGDEISARLSLENKRWRVAILDTTSGAHEELDTKDEGLASFDQAEWNQENPESPPFGTDDYLYPQLSQIHMGGLAVNGAPPRPRDVYSTWMSEDGSYLAPSNLSGDGFTVHQASLSPTSRRYLTIAGQIDAATRAYIGDLGHAGPATARERLIGAFTKMAFELRKSSWPGDVQELTDRLIGQTRTLANLARNQADDSSALSPEWMSESFQVERTGRAIRSALDLPQITSN